QTQDGSRSDLSFPPLPAVWDLVESDSGNCLGRKCPEYARCFYFKARRQVQGAQLLVVNHALFFTDLALRQQGGSFLPDYRVAILDEAHTLEDVAAERLGLQVSQGSVEYLLNKLVHPHRDRGLLVFHRALDAMRQVEVARGAADRFFSDVHAWSMRRPPGAGRVRSPHVVADPLSEELKKLASTIYEFT